MSMSHESFREVYTKLFSYRRDCPLLESRVDEQKQFLCDSTGMDEDSATLALTCITCSFVGKDFTYTPEQIERLRQSAKASMGLISGEMKKKDVLQCEGCDYQEPRTAKFIWKSYTESV
jgi:hypothetical protein